MPSACAMSGAQAEHKHAAVTNEEYSTMWIEILYKKENEKHFDIAKT